MGSLSEEFKDQKINDLLEDYIALEKKIADVSQRVVSLLEGTEERFEKSVSEGVQRLHSEVDISLNAWNRLINDADERSLQRIKDVATLISNIESEGGEYIAKLSTTVAEEKRGIIEEGGRAKESFHTEARRVVAEIKDELKKQAEGYRPPKTSTLIGYAFAGTLALSAAFTSGAYLYIHEKANADLNSMMPATKKLIEFAKEKVAELPANKREAAKNELDIILN